MQSCCTFPFALPGLFLFQQLHLITCDLKFFSLQSVVSSNHPTYRINALVTINLVKFSYEGITW